MATASSPSYAAQLQLIVNFLKIQTPITAEYRFHPPRQWRFDFAWITEKVAVEVEGGVYGRGAACPTCGIRRTGAHSSVSGIIADMEKYNRASLDGWIVLRVLPEELDLENGKAFNLIEAAFKLRKGQNNHEQLVDTTV